MQFATTFDGIAIGVHDSYAAAAAHIADAVSEAAPGTPEADDARYSIANADDVEPYADAAVCAAAHRYGDPDALPTVTIRSAYRNVGCNGSGPECFRRVRYPGVGVDGDEGEWPDAERLPPLGVRAAERRATAYCDVPVGTLVADFERQRFRGRGGRCTVTFALVGRNPETGKAVMHWLDHRTLRKRPVYEVALPDGGKTTWARRV